VTRAYKEEERGGVKDGKSRMGGGEKVSSEIREEIYCRGRRRISEDLFICIFCFPTNE
jgi:hypothetical protein